MWKSVKGLKEVAQIFSLACWVSLQGNTLNTGEGRIFWKSMWILSGGIQGAKP